MELVIDLDGTICEEKPAAQRCLAKPLPGAKEALLKLRKHKHVIIIFSARPWTDYNMTEHWLKTNNIPYDRLILGKPIGDLYIDDRAWHFDTWATIIKKII